MTIPKIPHLISMAIESKEDLKNFPNKFLNHGAGLRPIILNLEKLDKKQLTTFLDLLTNFLESVEIFPRWPYPIYIQTWNIDFHPLFEIINHPNQAAAHYRFEYNKKLMTKELQLLQKIHLLTKKISNLFPHDKNEQIQAAFKKNKKLLQETKRIEFYNSIRKSFKTAIWDAMDDEK